MSSLNVQENEKLDKNETINKVNQVLSDKIKEIRLNPNKIRSKSAFRVNRIDKILENELKIKFELEKNFNFADECNSENFEKLVLINL